MSVRVRPGAPKLNIQFYSCVNYLVYLEKKLEPLLQRIQKGYTVAVKDLKLATRPRLRLEPNCLVESSRIRASPFYPAVSAIGLEQTPGC